MAQPKYITSIDKVEGLSQEEKDKLRPITENLFFALTTIISN